MRRYLALLLAVLPACSIHGDRALFSLDLPPSTTQLILSTTDGWQGTAATVHCFERVGGDWLPASPKIPARVGRSGLGWGLGLHVDGDGPKKHEGDGRAPAGIFTLGTGFGYADAPPTDFTMPYRQATERDYFVDAADSPAYNQWQHIPLAEPNEPKSLWQSCERMRRDDALYEFGMVVNHNTEDIQPGRGSAIFLHVWRGPEVTTSGCTSMSREDLVRVLTWLRPEAQPLLVQMPADQLANLRCQE